MTDTNETNSRVYNNSNSFDPDEKSYDDDEEENEKLESVTSNNNNHNLERNNYTEDYQTPISSVASYDSVESSNNTTNNNDLLKTKNFCSSNPLSISNIVQNNESNLKVEYSYPMQQYLANSNFSENYNQNDHYQSLSSFPFDQTSESKKIQNQEKVTPKVQAASAYLLQPPDSKSIAAAALAASKNKNRRRTRTKFEAEQIQLLEMAFQKTHYPDVTMVDRLADTLRINTERISVWFQNRRARFKREKPSTDSTKIIPDQDFFAELEKRKLDTSEEKQSKIVKQTNKKTMIKEKNNNDEIDEEDQEQDEIVNNNEELETPIKTNPIQSHLAYNSAAVYASPSFPTYSNSYYYPSNGMCPPNFGAYSHHMHQMHPYYQVQQMCPMSKQIDNNNETSSSTTSISTSSPDRSRSDSPSSVNNEQTNYYQQQQQQQSNYQAPNYPYYSDYSSMGYKPSNYSTMFQPPPPPFVSTTAYYQNNFQPNYSYASADCSVNASNTNNLNYKSNTTGIFQPYADCNTIQSSSSTYNDQEDDIIYEDDEASN